MLVQSPEIKSVPFDLYFLWGSCEAQKRQKKKNTKQTPERGSLLMNELLVLYYANQGSNSAHMAYIFYIF